jgi:predicted kinase
MKLVFLYGAPSTGKLTVARELSALSGKYVILSDQRECREVQRRRVCSHKE